MAWLHYRQQPPSRLKLADASLRQQRGDEVLLVWGDLAHWMIVDHEMDGFLRQFDGSGDTAGIIRLAGGDTRQLCELVSGLFVRGVLSDAGSVSRRPVPHDDTQLENITVNLTRRCSLACRHCYLGRDSAVPNEATARDMVRFLHSVRKCCAAKASLMILGGEPTLQPQRLLELTSAGQDLQLQTLVSTNGQHITESLADSLYAQGVHVQVSIDGATGKTNDAIRGEGSFRKATAGVRQLVRSGVTTILSMVVTRANFAEMRSYLDLAWQLRVAEARFIPLRSTGAAAHLLPEVVPLDQLLNEIRSILREKAQWRQLLQRDAFSILGHTCRLSQRPASCGTGRKTILLDADGKLYPCGNLNHAGVCLGSIRDPGLSLRQLWEHSPVLTEVRRQTAIDAISEPCRTCAVRYWCLGGCRGESYAATGRLDAPSPHCERLRCGIIEMFWTLATEPDLVGQAGRAC